ncbi:MAG: hypothetical protein R2708_27665 [Vicinamibacterales bacterium]
MSPKHPPQKTGAPADEWKVTDEWGIADPDKAGIPALFARLGRPVLRAAPTSARRERRRALRPDRSGEGVGDCRSAAGGLDPVTDEVAAGPLVGNNPARAMRLALRAQNAAAAATPPAEPFVPPPVPEAERPPVEATAVTAADAPAPRRRATRKAALARSSKAPSAAQAAPAADRPQPRTRTRKTPAKSRARQAKAAAPTAPAEFEAAPAAPAVHVPPAPSPRRPRGPVPLAAWAHAATEPPKPEPVRDHRGFWRGLFRIPSEVALVEYAHGAKIHRLLIEAGDDHQADFI